MKNPCEWETLEDVLEWAKAAEDAGSLFIYEDLERVIRNRSRSFTHWMKPDGKRSDGGQDD